MDFLKNHYEKLILGLTLLLMAAGAVVLVLEASSVQEELDSYRRIIVESDGQRPVAEDLKTRRELLNRVTRPPQAEFSQVHRVFNPDAWYMDTNGNLIAGAKVGVSQLVVHSITPQHLILEFLGIGGSPERPSVSVNMTRQFGLTLATQGRTRRSFPLNATNTPANIANTSANMLDATRKLVFLARELTGPPENPEVKCELHEPGKDPLKFSLTKAQGYSGVVDYVAHIQYMVETNFVWRTARRDTQLIFAGDTNIVVDITASNVVVRAVSNDKTTILPLGPAQAAPPPAKK